MALKPRHRPVRLPEKLLTIRTALDLTQDSMGVRLGGDLTQNRISDYELGKVLPPWDVLLAYARAAGVCLELLIDDRLELPRKLPPRKRHSPSG